jgi:transposase
MIHAGCLAHSRRRHVGSAKLNAKNVDSVRIVALMDELFAIDREARERNMDHGERDALRQQRAPALLQRLRTELLAMQKKVLPKSATGQATNYTPSRWSKLSLFLKYPELELSTNLAENSMRPIAIGRKTGCTWGARKQVLRSQS